MSPRQADSNRAVDAAQDEEQRLRKAILAEELRQSYLTVEQAATITNRSVSMIRVYIRAGRLPVIREEEWPGRTLISPLDLAKLFANQPKKISGRYT